MEAESLEEVCGELILPRHSAFRSGLRRGFRDSARSSEYLSHFWYLIYGLELQIEIDDSLFCSQAIGYNIGYIHGLLKKSFRALQK